jgi:hypothetical protein
MAIIHLLASIVLVGGCASAQRTGGICPSAPELTPWSCPEWSNTNSKAVVGVWSHEPFCTGPTWDDDSNPDKQFCVYTSSKYRNGRGISILSTPKVAMQIALSRAFKLPPTQLDRFPSFEARELPGRGIGLYANETIRTGETILVDQPIFIVIESAYRVFSEHDQEFLQWKALLQMPRSGQQVTRSLAKNGTGDEIMDILQTNGFVQSYAGVPHVHLIPEGSRINHDCRPKSVPATIMVTAT